MEIYGKIWGQTSSIFQKNNVEICRIQGIAGGQSSMHTHAAKYSMFFVESGALAVDVCKNYGLIDTTTLGTGQSTIIKPGEEHRFRVLEDCVCFEIYWVELDPNDILRKDHGTINEIQPVHSRTESDENPQQ